MGHSNLKFWGIFLEKAPTFEVGFDHNQIFLDLRRVFSTCDDDMEANNVVMLPVMTLLSSQRENTC